MAPPKPTSNLSPLPGGREVTESRYLRALLAAFEQPHPERLDDPWLLRRVRRGVRLYPRDRKALKRGAREAGLPPAEYLTHVLLIARWAAKRALCHVGLDTELTEPQFQQVENGLTADFMRYLLGSDRTEAERAKRQDPLSRDQPANAGQLHERADALFLCGEEAAEVDAEVHRVFALATKNQKAQLRRILAALRKAPGVTFAEAATAAGLTPDQRKKLTSRLPGRLT